jgi:EAL domain-containing protein (putative c-di-GMP-specific phosphodiesterase class I)/ActR/RegA family two-component response regulator
VLERDRAASRGAVLVVDDIDAVGAVFERALVVAGFEVERAADGSEALDLLRRRQFDAILSDIGMPNVDGIQFLRVVRERDLDVPFVLVTGNPTVDTALHAIEYGALHYLRKPLTPKEIVAHMERAVQLGRMARLKREALDVVGGTTMRLGDRAGLEVGFQRALREIWMAYQPIVRWSNRSLFGFEALMRSDDVDLPGPEAMLSAADRLGVLPVLGRMVRDQVGSLLASHDLPLVFVNLHPNDMLDDELFLPTSPLARIATRVVLEITERASLDSITELKRRTAQLRALGFRIALDDLGAGYAGLSSIAQLEPDVMKIDMGLVRGVDREPTKKRLVAAMSNLCREMDVVVIAEGVETAAERDTLASLGCDLMQGHLFAKPARPFPAARF